MSVDENNKNLVPKQALIIYFFSQGIFISIFGYLINALVTAQTTNLNNTKLLIISIAALFSLAGWAFSTIRMFKSFQEIVQERVTLASNKDKEQDQ